MNGQDPGGSPVPTGSTASRHVSLCEAVDRLLETGVVLRGEVRISVADIDLVYLGLQVLLASTDTASRYAGPALPARAEAAQNSEAER